MLGDPKGSWELGGVLHIGHRFEDDRCLGKGTLKGCLTADPAGA